MGLRRSLREMMAINIPLFSYRRTSINLPTLVISRWTRFNQHFLIVNPVSNKQQSQLAFHTDINDLIAIFDFYCGNRFLHKNSSLKKRYTFFVKPFFYFFIFVTSKIDYRNDSCMQPIKDQGKCGSCWAFSTVSLVEFNNCVSTGNSIALR